MTESWDQRFMNLARHVAGWSKDRSRKVGCVVVGQNKEVRATGYNGFPRGVNDDVEERHQRPAKYDWTEHAERNAIYNAARVGTPLEDCMLYVSLFPCAACARAIIQSGIGRVVTVPAPENDPVWDKEFKVAKEMLHAAGIVIAYIGSPDA